MEQGIVSAVTEEQASVPHHSQQSAKHTTPRQKKHKNGENLTPRGEVGGNSCRPLVRVHNVGKPGQNKTAKLGQLKLWAQAQAP